MQYTKCSFVVAAVSPGGKETTGVKLLQALRGKRETSMNFSPLSLTHTKNFLECHGVKVKEQGDKIYS